MNNYLAVWTWTLPDGRRQEITMTFWANTDRDARHIAHGWWTEVCPVTVPVDFTVNNLTHERGAL